MISRALVPSTRAESEKKRPDTSDALTRLCEIQSLRRIAVEEVVRPFGRAAEANGSHPEAGLVEPVCAKGIRQSGPETGEIRGIQEGEAAGRGIAKDRAHIAQGDGDSLARASGSAGILERQHEIGRTMQRILRSSRSD